MIRVVVLGAGGRMGSAACRAVHGDRRSTALARLARRRIGGSVRAFCAGDFQVPTPELISACPLQHL
jgi:dihydrodipicolinate reductase